MQLWTQSYPQCLLYIYYSLTCVFRQFVIIKSIRHPVHSPLCEHNLASGGVSWEQANCLSDRGINHGCLVCLCHSLPYLFRRRSSPTPFPLCTDRITYDVLSGFRSRGIDFVTFLPEGFIPLELISNLWDMRTVQSFHTFEAETDRQWFVVASKYCTTHNFIEP